MAKRYPHTSVMGVDVAPSAHDEALLPTNVRFEIDDINLGIEHFHNKFDVVHMRCVMIGIRNFDKTMQDAQLCLKPGGLIIIIDGDKEFYAQDRLHGVKIPDPVKEGPNSEGSWFKKIVRGEYVSSEIGGARTYISLQRHTKPV